MADFEELEPWLAGHLARFSPAERTKAARAIGIYLRRTNSQRIRANQQPDGSAMEPRKPRKSEGKRGKIRGRTGPMFKQIGQMKNLRVRAAPDGVEITFAPRMQKTAAVHHFGLVDRVEKGSSIRTRYPARPLLGISEVDREAITDILLKSLDG